MKSQEFRDTEWKEKEIPTAQSFVFLRYLFMYLILAVPVVLLYVALTGIGLFFVANTVFIGFHLIFLFAFLIAQIDWLGSYYKLQASHYLEVQGKIKEYPGNVIVKRGNLRKRVRNYSFEEFTEARVEETLLMGIFNIGSIILEGERKVVLFGIKRPENYLPFVQKQIDELKDRFRA